MPTPNDLRILNIISAIEHALHVEFSEDEREKLFELLVKVCPPVEGGCYNA